MIFIYLLLGYFLPILGIAIIAYLVSSEERSLTLVYNKLKDLKWNGYNLVIIPVINIILFLAILLVGIYLGLKNIIYKIKNGKH